MFRIKTQDYSKGDLNKKADSCKKKGVFVTYGNISKQLEQSVELDVWGIVSTSASSTQILAQEQELHLISHELPRMLHQLLYELLASTCAR